MFSSFHNIWVEKASFHFKTACLSNVTCSQHSNTINEIQVNHMIGEWKTELILAPL